MCFFLMLGATEASSWPWWLFDDRCVAVCDLPLSSGHVLLEAYIGLVVASWIGGVPVQIGQHARFSSAFCGSNTINHFFCDIPPLLKLVSWDILRMRYGLYICIMFVTVPFCWYLDSILNTPPSLSCQQTQDGLKLSPPLALLLSSLSCTFYSAGLCHCHLLKA